MDCFINDFRVRKLYLMLKLIFLYAFAALKVAIAVKMRRLIVPFIIFCDAIGLTILMRKLMIILFTDIPLPSFAFKSAFTPPEMLMMLAITGSVAVLTIPEFVENQAELSTIVTLKQDFAVFSNGYNLAVQQAGTPDNWNLVGEGEPTGLASINNVISSCFKVSKNCGTGPGCFPTSAYKNLKGVETPISMDADTTYTKMQLINGTSIAIKQLNSGCNDKWGDSLALQNVCGVILLDTNGTKYPNTYGKDVFGFAFTKYGLVPMGTPMQSNAYPFNGFCNINSNANFKYENGLSCTAWAMYKQNFEYLDCPGLNWDNKTQCKS